MIDLILATPFVLWLLLLFAIILVPVSKRVNGKASFVGVYVAIGLLILNWIMSPISTYYNDPVSRQQVQTFYEEPVTAPVVDRTLKPKLTDEQRQQRNEELFDAMKQSKEILGD